MILILSCALALGHWLGMTSTAPSATIARDPSGNIVETDVTSESGMTTTTRAVYDAKTLVLLHAASHCDCSGAPFDAMIERNADATYTFEAKTGGSAPKDQKRDHVELDQGDLLVAGNELLVPLMAAKLHVTEVDAFDYMSMELIPEEVESVDGGDRPSGARASDTAVAIKPPREKNEHVTRFLWYDPCTYRVDAIDVNTVSIED